MDVFVSILFIVLLLWTEKNVFKTSLYSPFFWFAVPIVSIILLNNLVCTHFGFFSIGIGAILLNILGLFMFWLGGFFVLMIRRRQCLNSHIKKSTIISIQSKFIPASDFKYIIYFSIFIIVVGLLYLKSVLASRSLLQLEDQEFGQGGIIAHVGNYVTVCFIFFIAFYSYKIYKSKWLIVGMVCCLILKFATSIKAELMLPIICGIIFFLTTGKIKLTVKNAIAFFAIFLVFFSGMGLFFNIGQKDNQTEYAIAFFFFYIICGEVGLSEWIQTHNHLFSQDNANLISVFFINVYEKFFGCNEMVKFSHFSSLDWITISDNYFGIPFRTNVFSLIGEVYLNCGIIISSIFFMLLGVYYYIIFCIAKSNICLMILYSYICGILTLSFFSCYVLLPAFIEIQILIFIFYLLSISKQTHKCKRIVIR